MQAPQGRRNKNFKQLSLDKPSSNLSGASIEDAQLPGSQANAAALSSKFAALEIGLEFQLDLRNEELEKLSEIGSGNGGTVTKVIHKPTQTIMAKKVIRVEGRPEVRKQIVRELQIMHDCNSPYIVSFYGAFMCDDTDIYMCMEYMDCGSLDRIVKTHGPIEQSVIGQITIAIIEGLDYLYSMHRIIHRDVKPSNVLVNSQGAIKLCDFGVSGELINSIADTFVGTSFYMSPERIQGAAYSVKSDVWSVGITLIELAIGHSPYAPNAARAEGSSGAEPSSRAPARMSILDLLQQIVLEDPPSLSPTEYAPDLCAFVHDCCIKDMDARPGLRQLKNTPFFQMSRKPPVPDLKKWALSMR